jgi:signal recognition particle GTPase
LYGLFDKLFGKKEKQSLNEGLEKTRENIFSRITKAVAGKSTVDEEVLDELEDALVAADVGIDTTVKIIEQIEQRVARDKYLNTSELNNILQEENRSTTGRCKRRILSRFQYSQRYQTLYNSGSWSEWCGQNHHYWKACT